MAFTQRQTGMLQYGSHRLWWIGQSPHQELKESFETLETMAGEISGSVFIVKQIDVLPVLSGLVQSQPERWEGHKRKRRDMLGTVHELS